MQQFPPIPQRPETFQELDHFLGTQNIISDGNLRQAGIICAGVFALLLICICILQAQSVLYRFRLVRGHLHARLISPTDLDPPWNLHLGAPQSNYFLRASVGAPPQFSPTVSCKPPPFPPPEKVSPYR